MVVCGSPSRSGVAITAGEMALTVMSPWPATSLASDLVRQMRPALLAEYGPSAGLASLPAIAAGTEKARVSPPVRAFGTRVWTIASSTGQACFSRGFSRPSAMGRRASALNMFAKRSVAVP